MSPDDHVATLPELERLLVATARDRRATRRHSWRWPAGFAALVVVAGVGAAAAGVLSGGSEIDSGQTADGSYVIKIKADSKHHPAGSICLQLRHGDSRPAYGCGVRSSRAQPFGLVVADASVEGSGEEGPTERVVYGLVTREISRVSVLGSGSQHFDAETLLKRGLPGRYFSVVAPNEGRIEVVGFNLSGAEIARIGSREEPTHPPLSHDEAVAQGDPAGFAPTAVPVRHFTYHGQAITPEDADRLDLTCVEGGAQPPCYDSAAEANAAGIR